MIPLSRIAKDIAELVAADQKAGVTDADILAGLLQPQDVGEPFAFGNNCYLWWHHVGTVFCPKRVLEIGTRFGYSLLAVYRGTDWGPEDMSVAAYDCECNPGDKEPLKVFAEFFRGLGIQPYIHRADTQTTPYLSPPFAPELAVVDGNHSEAGAYHDIRLVAQVLTPGGIIVVDDTNPGEVSRAVERFCADTNWNAVFLPSLHGMSLIRKSE